jgi:hypothetical protein
VNVREQCSDGLFKYFRFFSCEKMIVDSEQFAIYSEDYFSEHMGGQFFSGNAGV